MLGKTHVVGSLAVAHVALIAYTTNKSNEYHIASGADGVGMVGAPSDGLEIFGFQFGSSLSLMEYGLLSAVVTLFVLLLLRVGNKKMLGAYFGLIIACMAIMLLSFDTRYAFELSCIMLAFALGTILPDIDSPNSTIGKYVKPISELIPHRTITHTLWAVLLLGGLTWWFESIYLLALTLGYTLHILEDSFSKQGIRWLYPIPAKARIPITYEVGGAGEMIMLIVAIAVHAVSAGFVVWSQISTGAIL